MTSDVVNEGGLLIQSVIHALCYGVVLSCIKTTVGHALHL